MGKIITFYSYKGGTGRSMALANVGYLLASWGYKVLMVDWDLEAPGLQNFFKNYSKEKAQLTGPGIVELLSVDQNAEEIKCSHSREWEQYVIKIPLSSTNENLHFLTAGKEDKEYNSKLRGLDFDMLYSEYNGGEALEILRNEWKENYDYVLIDSRTGITDIGGICTIQMPDVLVLLFTATEQAINGIVEVAQRAYEAQKELNVDRLRLVSIPVASRFDSREEFENSQKWLQIFASKLKPIYENWLPTSVKTKEMIETTKIPYSTYFSFGEKLAAVEQSRNDAGGLTYSYENIAALIANNLENVEMLVEDRHKYIGKASRVKKRNGLGKKRIFISYSHKDKAYLDKLLVHFSVLERFSKLDIWEDRKIEAGHSWYENLKEELKRSQIAVLLVTADYLASPFMTREELPRILDMEQESNLKVIPVIVRPCAWKMIPTLNRRQVFPHDGMPLSEFSGEEQESKMSQLTELIANEAGVDSQISSGILPPVI